VTDDGGEPVLVLLTEDDGSVSSIDLDAFDRHVRQTVSMMQQAHGVDAAHRLGRVGDALFRLSDETSPAYLRWWASDVASLTLRLLLMRADARSFLWMRINFAAFCFAYRLRHPVDETETETDAPIRRASDSAADEAGEVLLESAVATAEHLIDADGAGAQALTELRRLAQALESDEALTDYAIAVSDLISRFALHTAERGAIEGLLERFTSFATEYRSLVRS
jgi:hypothetical protein